MEWGLVKACTGHAWYCDYSFADVESQDAVLLEPSYGSRTDLIGLEVVLIHDTAPTSFFQYCLSTMANESVPSLLNFDELCEALHRKDTNCTKVAVIWDRERWRIATDISTWLCQDGYGPRLAAGMVVTLIVLYVTWF
jgi:hypothetical protein